ncbi:hypothetical protein [Nostoc cycadae]|uniref:Uncharacterized protein n=1 Tax=Nostoc cycadae WK-1 TaxID=1861711 RepID=A0A2H6LR67_9NOSO|nr:hypothetical protein [Nostoc cycadae]GBE95702.1 hypothetical protein NCWK1_5490 [Nostoc cycadae WK-1]
MTQPTKAKLKNHITSKGKRLGQALNSKFGVTLADFDAAMNGNIQVAQKIGELAKQGRLSSELAPRLAQAYIEIISGSEAYNKATADILLQAGRSAIAIDKSVSQVMIANSRYGHERKELASEFYNAKLAEDNRHIYQMNLSQVRGYLDAHLIEVDRNTAMTEQFNRPEIKQIAADEQLQQRQLNEALAKGDQARYDLIPEKKYGAGIKAKILEFKAALGF